MPKISLALLLLILVAAAQQPAPKQQQPPNTPPQAGQAQQPTSGAAKFSTGTSLVIETVIARDKSGKIIEGLTAKDFVITEDGVAQDVSICEFQKLEDTPAPELQQRPTAPPIPTAPEKPKVDPVVASQIQPEAPGDVRYKDRRLMALYFDLSA